MKDEIAFFFNDLANAISGDHNKVDQNRMVKISVILVILGIVLYSALTF